MGQVLDFTPTRNIPAEEEEEEDVCTMLDLVDGAMLDLELEERGLE